MPRIQTIYSHCEVKSIRGWTLYVIDETRIDVAEEVKKRTRRLKHLKGPPIKSIRPLVFASLDLALLSW